MSPILIFPHASAGNGTFDCPNPLTNIFWFEASEISKPMVSFPSNATVNFTVDRNLSAARKSYESGSNNQNAYLERAVELSL